MLLAVCSAAQAQTVYYSTGFDGTDVVNGTNTAAPYNSPNAPTDPLDSQNGWTTNDSNQAGTYGTSTQLVGRSDFVGDSGAFTTGQQGVLGGFYRTTAANATGAAPDVIPSTATGGVVTLGRPFTMNPAASQYVFNVDFEITASSTNFPSHDSFAWTFGNGTATAFTINFTPSTTNTDTRDAVTATVGTTTVQSAGNGITLGTQYHLTVSVSTGTTPTFTATIGGTTGFTFSGSLVGADLAPSAVTDIAATWNLADKTTISNGGYQNAGDNVLVFDNYSISAAPEPSTYAMIALGTFGLAVTLRVRRQA